MSENQVVELIKLINKYGNCCRKAGDWRNVGYQKEVSASFREINKYLMKVMV